MSSQHIKEMEINLKPVPEGILPPGSTADSQLGLSVINLSNLVLKPEQVKALEKGLTFCPTPAGPDISHIWCDMEEFFRRLRLKRFFDEIISDTDETSNKFKEKST
jgi:hypothetical protein